MDTPLNLRKRSLRISDALAIQLPSSSRLYFIGSLTGSFNMFVSLLLLFVANYKERKEIPWKKQILIYLLFVISYVMICVVSFAGISSILVTITAVVTLTSIWWLPPQKMRAVGACNSVVYLSYQILIKNWAGLLEILVLLANVASFMKYHEKKKEI